MIKSVKKKIPGAIAVVLLGLLVVYGFWPAPIDVDVVTVTEGSIEVTVNDDGETRTREKFVVSAPVAGKLLRVQLHAGDIVRQGVTELARIQPSTPDPLDARKRAEYEARLRGAEASLQLAQSTLDVQREQLALSQDNFDRVNTLMQTSAVSASEFDTVEHHLRISEANVRSAEFGVKVASFEMELCRAAVSRYDVDEPETPEEAFQLVAPVNGRVLRVFKEDSGIVAAATPILELGDITDLEVVVDVLSSDAVTIKPGQRVLMDHWGESKTLHAVVRVVEPSAFLKVSALGVEEKRVNIVADFVEPWKDRKSLGDGFRIEARIVTAMSSPESLKVSTGTLFRDQSGWKAYRVHNHVAELVAVEVGLTNGIDTEVLSGLSEGDRVVLYPTAKVQHGVRVNEVR